MNGIQAAIRVNISSYIINELSKKKKKKELNQMCFK